MHLRHPVVLTTVEEDFKKIGILTEDDDKPVSEKKGKKAENDDADADDTEEEVFGDKEDSVKKATKKESADTSSETLDEKAIRLKRHTSGERLRWRRAKKKGSAKAAARKYRKKSTVKRMMRKHRLKAMRLRHGKPAGRRRLVFGNDQIANMMEEAQALIQSLDEQKVEHSVKAFANIAIIAEMLARSFAKFSEDAEGEDSSTLDEAADFFREMAAEAADIARTLKAGPVEEDEDLELDFDALGEVFKAQMSDLLNGLEMYADITEDDDLKGEITSDDDTETVAESDDDDEDDEEDDDEKPDDDEDDEPGKEGNATKKLPPFMKKKAEGKGKAKK